jgi:putative glutamine amidotransferase
MHQPLVAISTDVRQFDNYTWHAAPQQYIEAALSGAGVFPLLVPSFGDRLDFDELLSSVDGVMVTGSKSNVHPSLYGGDASEANGPYDPARDSTTLPLIRKAIERGVPLLAICRGIQELNVALGGTLGTEIQEREGTMDHRAPVSDKQDERFAIRQPVKIAPGSCLAGIFGDRIDLDRLLASVDGVMITGSKSNVHPSLYGEEATEANGPYDTDRDATTLPLIRKAIERGVPLLAICRGLQEMNVALGGTLGTEIQEREGSLDHRAPISDSQDERFAIRQSVSIKPGSCLAGVFGAGDILVNSVHRQGVDRLGPKLQVEAVAEDGTVEAVSVRNSRAFAVGVQWHPEYWVKSDDASQRIFRAFGEAVRQHAAAKVTARTAAE